VEYYYSVLKMNEIARYAFNLENIVLNEMSKSQKG
jgi:hypothetical protein